MISKPSLAIASEEQFISATLSIELCMHVTRSNQMIPHLLYQSPRSSFLLY